LKKRIIGRKDKGDFPDLGLKDIDIKIDTGAYTSALHCTKIISKEVKGKKIVTFTLLDPTSEHYDSKKITTDDFREKRIKSSFGSSEKRYIVKTQIILFGEEYEIDLSLSERGEMKIPILIGRKFLMGKFIVNPSKYDISYKLKKSKKKK